MISAWVFYYSEQLGRHEFELRDGTDFTSTDPEDWGLRDGDAILLVLQHASFLAAFIYGEPVRR